jgi:hypothetical protein
VAISYRIVVLHFDTGGLVDNKLSNRSFDTALSNIAIDNRDSRSIHGGDNLYVGGCGS